MNSLPSPGFPSQLSRQLNAIESILESNGQRSLHGRSSVILLFWYSPAGMCRKSPPPNHCMQPTPQPVIKFSMRLSGVRLMLAVETVEKPNDRFRAL